MAIKLECQDKMKQGGETQEKTETGMLRAGLRLLVHSKMCTHAFSWHRMAVNQKPGRAVSSRRYLYLKN